MNCNTLNILFTMRKMILLYAHTNIFYRDKVANDEDIVNVLGLGLVGNVV